MIFTNVFIFSLSCVSCLCGGSSEGKAQILFLRQPMEKNFPICKFMIAVTFVPHCLMLNVYLRLSLCLTNCFQLRGDKSLLIWRQFSECIICPVHGTFAGRNPSHARIGRQKERDREERGKEANGDLRQQWRVAQESP